MEAEMFAATLDKQSQSECSKLPTETLKTANLLFGSFEPYFIWDFLARLFRWGKYFLNLLEAYKAYVLFAIIEFECLFQMYVNK